jgi:hypothetical protein
MRLFVKTLEGNSTTIEVDPQDTIARLKELVGRLYTLTQLQIEDQGGFPVEYQRLIFAGKLLDDQRTVRYYNIEKESTLHLLPRIKG